MYKITLKVIINRQNFDLIDYQSLQNDNLLNRLIAKIHRLPLDSKMKNNFISNIQTIAKQKLIQKIQQIMLTIDICETLAIKHSEEMFKGSQMMINDNGELYDLLWSYQLCLPSTDEVYPNKDARTSPATFARLLPGLYCGKNLEHKSWFQFQHNSIEDMGSFFIFLTDYLCSQNN